MNFQCVTGFIWIFYFLLEYEWHVNCRFNHNSKELNLEPLSIFSVIFQLATATPDISKVFMKEENSNLTRTQVIEFYRSNMSSNFQDKPNN